MPKKEGVYEFRTGHMADIVTVILDTRPEQEHGY